MPSHYNHEKTESEAEKAREYGGKAKMVKWHALLRHLLVPYWHDPHGQGKHGSAEDEPGAPQPQLLRVP